MNVAHGYLQVKSVIYRCVDVFIFIFRSIFNFIRQWSAFFWDCKKFFCTDETLWLVLQTVGRKSYSKIYTNVATLA